MKQTSRVIGVVVSYASEPFEETICQPSRAEWRNYMRSRDYRIWYASRRGYPVSRIAQKIGLSRQQVNNILKRFDARTGEYLTFRMERRFNREQCITSQEKKLATGLIVMLSRCRKLSH